jgi:hypothetical protein
VTDNTWSGFQRLPALPEALTKVTPATGFTATAKTVTYIFNTSIHSTSYVLEIYTGGKLWKKVTLAHPRRIQTQSPSPQTSRITPSANTTPGEFKD